DVIENMDKPYTWVQSYITGDKIYCVHIAESENEIREHARLGKFPINTISEVKTIIDPTSGNPL
ncbi:MAG TPA: nickel-binding protein, partial [Chitinophagaceae bacterium]|nr:nickel-binding protein [Chitinophagaceae bacterium]